MSRENLDKIERLLSKMNHLAALIEMEPLSLNALNLKITEFRTTGLDQIVDLLKKTEMTPEEKLALVEFFVSTKDLEQDRFTKALLNHEPVRFNFLRVLKLTEVAEKYDSFFLGHEQIKTHWIQWYSNSKDATFNAETLREDIAALFEHKSKINQPELWSSNVLLRLDKPVVLCFIQWNLSRKGTIQRTWKGMNLGIGFSTSTKKQECWLSNCNPPTPRCFDFFWITNRSSCSTPLRPTRGHWIQFHGATLSSLKLTAWIQAKSYIHSCIILRNLSPCLQI